ncbi:hypothetical protein ABEB36_012922 [Hypothenemus hampei]|uniref:Uncharacterized protein n=1 Tax=Hypothenemus hampei TaxID=57062 RepID=A0ABD1E8Y5_HYPHA
MLKNKWHFLCALCNMKILFFGHLLVTINSPIPELLLKKNSSSISDWEGVQNAHSEFLISL